VVDVGAEFQGRVAWHDACHGLRELNLKEEPRKLLRNVKGLEFIEMPESEVCCGFGGTFSIKFPFLSVAMGNEKIESVNQSKADYITSGDSSCLMHLASLMSAKGSGPKPIHIAEILAGSSERRGEAG
jgi:L-lactate dehydrogenase complex protein LldE